MTQIEQELTKRTNEILYYQWDPIGVNDFGAATRDEYDSYVPMIVKAILAGATQDIIEKILYKIETESMEMKGQRDKRKTTAELLINWYDFLKS